MPDIRPDIKRFSISGRILDIHHQKSAGYPVSGIQPKKYLVPPYCKISPIISCHMYPIMVIQLSTGGRSRHRRCLIVGLEAKISCKTKDKLYKLSMLCTDNIPISHF